MKYGLANMASWVRERPVRKREDGIRHGRIDRLIDRSGTDPLLGENDLPLVSKLCSLSTSAYFGSRINLGTESCINEHVSAI